MPRIKCLFDVSTLLSEGDTSLILVGNLINSDYIPAHSSLTVANLQTDYGMAFSQVEAHLLGLEEVLNTHDIKDADYMNSITKMSSRGLKVIDADIPPTFAEAFGQIPMVNVIEDNGTLEYFDTLRSKSKPIIVVYPRASTTLRNWTVVLGEDYIDEPYILAIYAKIDRSRMVPYEEGPESFEVVQREISYDAPKYAHHITTDADLIALEPQLQKFYIDKYGLPAQEAHGRAIKAIHDNIKNVVYGKRLTLPSEFLSEIKKKQDTITSYLKRRKKKVYRTVLSKVRGVHEQLNAKVKEKRRLRRKMEKQKYEWVKTSILSEYRVGIRCTIDFNYGLGEKHHGKVIKSTNL